MRELVLVMSNRDDWATVGLWPPPLVWPFTRTSGIRWVKVNKVKVNTQTQNAIRDDLVVFFSKYTDVHYSN